MGLLLGAVLGRACRQGRFARVLPSLLRARGGELAVVLAGYAKGVDEQVLGGTKPELVDITDELKAATAYSELRMTRNTKSLAGIREKTAKEKEAKK